MSLSPYLLVSMTCLFWSLNIIIGKLVGGVIPPSTLSFLRWILPLLFFLPFGWKDIRANRDLYLSRWKLILALGASGYCLNGICLYSSVRFTSAINTSFINAFNPVLIAVTGFVMYRYPIRPNQVLGFLVSLLGVMWIIFKGNPALALSLRMNVGDLFMLASIAFWSINTILYKRHFTALPAKSIFVVMMFAGVLSTIPLMVAENVIGGIDWIGEVGIRHVAGILCLNIFPSILAYRFWNKALETISANKVAIFQYLIPVYTVAISLLFLGDRLMAFQVVGGALIFLGVLLVTNNRFERVKAPIAEGGT